MSNLKIELSRRKKLIVIIVILLFAFVCVVNVYILRTANSYFGNSIFNIDSQYTHPEVAEWVIKSDISGKGVFVLKLSRERIDQFFFGQARPVDQELPENVFGVFIYINSFENGDIERVLGRVEIADSTFKVLYRTKSTYENLNDDELFNNRDTYEQFLGYELSGISVVGAVISNLEIYFNGEKVDFQESMLN